MSETPSQPYHRDPSTGGPSWGTPPTATPPGARFFDGIRSLGVVRPDDGRWIAGVCAGLGRRWGIDPRAVRIFFVILSLLTGVGAAVYGLLWLLLPHPDGRIHVQQVLTGTVTAGFVGGLIAVLADGPFDHEAHLPGTWHRGPGVIPLLVVVAVVWWLLRGRRSGRSASGR